MHKPKLKPYRPRLLLSVLDSRLKFCKLMREQIINEQPVILDKIIWPDEVSLMLQGNVNSHNCFYRADENSHFTITSQLNQPGVMWSTLSNDCVVGPTSYDRTGKSINCLNMICDLFVAQFQIRTKFSKLFFKQDETFSH